MIALLDLQAEYKSLKPAIDQEIMEVLQSGTFILGNKGKRLEETVSKYLGVQYAISLANGTDALLLALEALGIGEGDEVITTPFTFFATAEVIARTGAVPVFVDIDQDTLNMDPEQIKQAITKKTKAIIVVHLFGSPAVMDRIMEIAIAHQLYVIEDACQAIGASYKGTKVGSIGHIGCFSFFPTKNLGAYGDGGMLVTNDKDIYEKVSILRNHGSKERYYHTHIGLNSRLDEIQAAILLVKFTQLDQWNQRRRDLAMKYTNNLKAFVKIPKAAHNEHVYHQYCIMVNQRDELMKFLQANEISTGIYYPVPLHLQKSFKYLGYVEGQFPHAEETAKTILALPVHPFLREDQQNQVISKIQRFKELYNERN